MPGGSVNGVAAAAPACAEAGAVGPSSLAEILKSQRASKLRIQTLGREAFRISALHVRVAAACVR